MQKHPKFKPNKEQVEHKDFNKGIEVHRLVN